MPAPLFNLRIIMSSYKAKEIQTVSIDFISESLPAHYAITLYHTDSTQLKVLTHAKYIAEHYLDYLSESAKSGVLEELQLIDAINENKQKIQSVSLDSTSKSLPARYNITINYQDRTQKKSWVDAKTIAEQYCDYLSESDRKDLFEAIEFGQACSPKANLPTPQNSSSSCDISMQILGGFMAVLGAAAIALALVAPIIGIAGLVMTGVGTAAVLAGIGLFAVGSLKKCEPDSPTNHAGLSLS